jgi:hypothetical protein
LGFPVHIGIKLRHALFDLLFGVCAGITVFLLEQASEDIEPTRYLVQVVIGELAPPNPGFPSHLFPLAYECIFIHEASFGSFEMLSDLRRRSGQHNALDFKSLISQMVSSKTNARGNRPQAFGHTLGQFTFTDKRIRARGKGGLLTGV